MQSQRSGIAGLVLTGLLLAPCGFSPAATLGGPIGSGETRQGSILAPGGADSWSFEATAGDRIVVAAITTSGALDTDIFLDAPGGGVETSTHGAFGGADRLDHRLSASGSYTLRIQDWSLSNTGTYDITLMKIPGALGSSADPDGGSIASGQTLPGQMNMASDLDGFQFTGTIGDRILVTAVTLSGSCDTDLYLYPPGGGPAFASTHGAFGGGDRLETTLPATGMFTILIADWALSRSGLYAITFLSTAATAAAVHSGETLAGQILLASDLEAYQFHGADGDRVIIAAVTTSGSLDTDLSLYRPRGGAAIVASHGAFGGGDRIECRLDSTGTYTLVVSDWSLARNGDYRLTFLQLPGATGFAGDTDGGPIPMGASLAGAMQAASDLDAYPFYAGAGTRVLLAAVTESGGLDTDMSLYPPGGGPAVSTTHGAFGGGDLLEFQITTSGVQTLVVADWSLSQTGEYHLTYLKLPGSASWEGDRDGGLIRIEGLGFPAFPAPSAASIGVRGDLDAFEFYGTPGDRVRILASTTAGALDTDLVLYPPNGAPAEATSHGAFGGGDILERQLAAQGLYTIVVRDWSLQQTGDYNVTLFKLAGGLDPGLYGPQPPVGGRVYFQGGSHFAWVPVAGATSYDVYFGTDVTTPLELLEQTPLSRADMPVLVPADAVYYWRVIATSAGGTIEGPVWWFRSAGDPTDVAASAPAGPRALLFQNEPNPFNPTTAIRFWLASPGRASLCIYDAVGRRVRTLMYDDTAAGEHRLAWDGCDASGRRVGSGVYFYRLLIGNRVVASRRMLLVE